MNRFGSESEETVRTALRDRGLLYFKDIHEQIRRCNPRARSALAVAAADRLVRQRLADADADALDYACATHVDRMWTALTADPTASQPDSASLVPQFISMDGPHMDRDSVAATVFAAEALTKGDANSAMWAVARLCDDQDARMAAATAEPSTDPTTAFIELCAAPESQRLLRALRSSMALVSEQGVSLVTLAEVRQRLSG